jgi:hypothetical protein
MVSNILEDFDVDIDIWELHPQMKILFKEQYENEVPSNVMWALLLDCHPKSYFADLEQADRRILLAQDYIHNESFDWRAYEEILAKMKKVCLTRPERLLKNWEDKLEERDAFIYNTPYNEDNLDMLEKAMKETYKMWENYEKVLAAFRKQEDESAMGGAQESLSERGLL